MNPESAIPPPAHQANVLSHTPDISIFQFKKLVNPWERTFDNFLKMYGMSCRVVLLVVAAMDDVENILSRRQSYGKGVLRRRWESEEFMQLWLLA